MKPFVNASRFITFFLFALSVFSQANQTLSYNYEYRCNKEQIVIGRCRHDSDVPGIAPTTPENDYCQVIYPDRPKQGGFTVETVELRSDVIKKLTACGAMRQTEPVSLASEGDANDANAEFKAGNEYFDGKDYAKAAEHFKKSAAVGRSFAAYLYLGIAYYNLKQYPAAIDALKVTISMVPAMPQAHYWLGVTYFGSAQYTSAESELREATRLKPDYQESYDWLGMTLAREKKYPDAIGSFQQALRLKPDNWSTVYLMGVIYVNMGQKEKATQVYQKLLALDKKFAQDLLDYINKPAAATSQETNKENGRTAPSKPTAPATGAATALVARAKAFFDAKDYAKAIEACKKAIALEPKNADANGYLALSYDQSEQWESAVKAWNNYIPLVKPLPIYFIDLGDANRNLGNYYAALKAYRRSLELKPNAEESSEINFGIGATYREMKQYDKALTPLLESIRLDPDYEDARIELGRSYMSLRRGDEGIASFKEAIRLKPNDAEAHYLLGMAYSVTHRKFEAMQEYKKLQTLDKTSADQLLKDINEP